MKKIILLLALLLLPKLGFALRVGVAPGLQYLGEVDRGDEVRLDFYVVSDTPEELFVSLKYGSPDMNSLRFSKRVNASEISEESIRSWFNYMGGKRLLVPPGKKFFEEVGLSANKKYSVILNIPEDAEPGYHACELSLNPEVSTNKKGLGATIITTAAMRVLLKVPGQASREGKVIGFFGERVDEKRELVRVFFKNTGTVTISPRLERLRVFNQKGEMLAEASGTADRVKPGEIAELRTIISTTELEEGREYNVSALVNYSTGESAERGTIAVKEYAKEARLPEKREGPSLFWVILLIAGFIVIVYYLTKR